MSPSDHARPELAQAKRLQTTGVQIVGLLYMLIRNARIHNPDNAIFRRPLENLRDAMNALLATERQMELQVGQKAIYLNTKILRFDISAIDHVRYLTREFESRDVGGFSADRPVTVDDLKNFIYLFTGDKKEFSAAGAEGHRLATLRLAHFKAIRELIAQMADSDMEQRHVDRKKYAMTVYARAVVLMKNYFTWARSKDTAIPMAKIARLVQDLIDICIEQREHFLGLTTTRSQDDFVAYHLVNTCLLAIVFGAELGLDKRQLHELGMAAIFHDVGLGVLPEDAAKKERDWAEREPWATVAQLLDTSALDRETMDRLLVAYECKRPAGNGPAESSLYGRMVALCRTFDLLTSHRPDREPYGPEIALALMCGPLEPRFDPALLRVFLKVLAIVPLRVLQQGERTIRMV